MPRQSALYEARITDLKEAHEARIQELMRTIDVLAEQVEYLRATGGIPQPLRTRGAGINTAQLETPDLPRFGPSQYMTEEEEDVRALHSNGLLDEQSLRAALDEMGIDQP